MDTNTPFTDINQLTQQPSNDNSAFVDASGDTTGGSSAFTDIQPTDVQKGEQYLGNEDFENLCQVFFQQMTGLPTTGTNAEGSFNQYLQQGIGHQGLQGAQVGDGIFFKGDNSNGGNGHVAIIANILPNGDMNIISPDYSGVHMHKLSDWLSQTGQQPMGYVDPSSNQSN